MTAEAEELTLDDVARLTRRTRTTVERWVQKGKLRVVRSPVTRRVFVTPEAFAELARAINGTETPAAGQ